MTPALPQRPPFSIRTRLLTPHAHGGIRWEDDVLVRVDERGVIGSISQAPPDAMDAGDLVDLRPWVLMPGLIDLHAHLPQLPNAGVGAGLHLLAWLERYIFPLEREFDEATAERVAPAAFRAFARAGTTTVVAYGAIWQPSLDTCFREEEAHCIRAVLGKVMMDRLS